jgi:adenine-specific DNA-methyltransferase
MARKINYNNWSKEELIKELRRIKETKYGLVWHRDLPEEKIDVLINPDARTPNEMFPNEMTGKPFPVLREVKTKEIKTDKSKPFNLLIEGDNYHSLAVLNFTHQETVDLIYIDPPYNTGNDDFIYSDKIKSGYVKEDDPFRHSKWISFMEKRLKLSKNLLKKTGAIFISIDDNEMAPLKLLCDEIFGENNFLTTFIWHRTKTPPRLSKNVARVHDYILCYAKNINFLQLNKLQLKEDYIKKTYKNPDNDPRGLWRLVPLLQPDNSSNKEFAIKMPDGRSIKGKWRCSLETFNRYVKDKLLVVSKDGSPNRKLFLSENEGQIVDTWLDNIATNEVASKEIENLFGSNAFFTAPKPTDLMKYLIGIGTNKDAVVLDFFAGSGTTGHAVLKMNKEDNGNRRFILCTNNENDICTKVCYPRIKKIIKGYRNIKKEDVKGFGGNLKYYVCAFVEAEQTDRNKRKLVNESTEMLCIKENTFELVQDKSDFKIFKNSDKYLGIIFYEEAIDAFKKAIKIIKGEFDVYVFSLGDDPHEKQFTDVRNRVSLCAIPEVILKVYREIFK